MQTDGFVETIAREEALSLSQVAAVAALLEEGASIPFIARYRKEATDSLDEVAVTTIRDRIHQLKELAARRQAVLASLEKNGHLTDELAQKVAAAPSMAVLEDIYLPYKPKRRTRTVMAREKGLRRWRRRYLNKRGSTAGRPPTPSWTRKRGWRPWTTHWPGPGTSLRRRQASTRMRGPA